MAGDGRWAGALFLPHTDVTVSLVVDGERLDGGPVKWSAPDIPRDLDLTMRAGVLTVNAREANPHSEGNGSSGDLSTARAPSGGAFAGMDGGAWLIGLGAALFVLLCILMLGYRTRERVRRGPIAGVILQPVGGFAGPGSPPLNDGLIYWRTADEEATGVLRALVDTLARHHGVLLVGPSLPEGLGRPGRRIFMEESDNPRRVGDVLEAIHSDPREPGVVVFCGVQGSPDDWADRDDELPLGTGGIVLLPPDVDAPEPTFIVRTVAPGVCVVEGMAGGDAFYIGDRGRWPDSSAPAVVHP